MKRLFLMTVGFISFGIGSIGTLIPVLPTTPFLLLSGFCFARSSEKFNVWLKQQKIYDFYVGDYAEHRAIPRAKKYRIIAQIYLIMGASVLLAPIIWVKWMVVGLMIFLTIMLFFVIPDKPEEN
ncbi:YbaN family protein [Fundicoccus ignavus]|nr:YbaN family protein [Fundicoccus ignavus]